MLTVSVVASRMNTFLLQSEIEVLKAVNHPNIIKIFDVYEDYNNIYIVQE